MKRSRRISNTRAIADFKSELSSNTDNKEKMNPKKKLSEMILDALWTENKKPKNTFSYVLVLLLILASSYLSYGQLKGRFSLEFTTPVTGIYKKKDDISRLSLGLSANAGYYISNKFSVGLLGVARYSSFFNYAQDFKGNTTSFDLIPFIRYDILRKKWTPFVVWSDIFSVGIGYSKNNNPQVPIQQRKQAVFLMNIHVTPKIFIPTTVGIKYHLQDNLNVSVWYSTPQNFISQFSNNIGIGCQYYF